MITELLRATLPNTAGALTQEMEAAQAAQAAQDLRRLQRAQRLAQRLCAAAQAAHSEAAAKVRY